MVITLNQTSETKSTPIQILSQSEKSVKPLNEKSSDIATQSRLTNSFRHKKSRMNDDNSPRPHVRNAYD